MNDLINKLLTLIRGDVVILQRFFQRQIDETSSLKKEINNLTKEVSKQRQPVVNIPPAKVEITVPDVVIPEIKIPKINVPQVQVEIPEIKLPTINIPKAAPPVVNVEAPNVEVKIPKQMTVEGFKEFAKQIIALLQEEKSDGLTGVDYENPLPVILMTKDGKPYRAGGGSVSVGGGLGGTGLDPTDPYKISDVDDAGSPQYYGFLDRDDHWFIMKVDTTAKTYRYIAGPSNYPTNWTNRATLTYDYFSNIF
jgi:hypothetical protein